MSTKTYRVTYVRKSDYCNIRPSDPECLFSCTVEADNKVQAIERSLPEWEINRRERRIPHQVWEIVELSTSKEK